MVCVSGSISKEDSVMGINEGVRVVQGDLVPSVVLAVSTFTAEPPVLGGMSVYVVLLGTRDEFVEGMRM